MVILKKGGLRNLIMQEAHRPSYAEHLGSTKMREDLKQKFYWSGMKKDRKIYF